MRDMREGTAERTRVKWRHHEEPVTFLSLHPQLILRIMDSKPMSSYDLHTFLGQKTGIQASYDSMIVSLRRK